MEWICVFVSLQSCSNLAFRNKIVANIGQLSLLLLSHRICPASENIISQGIEVATRQSLLSTDLLVSSCWLLWYPWHI